jgi:hypothetical protein
MQFNRNRGGRGLTLLRRRFCRWLCCRRSFRLMQHTCILDHTQCKVLIVKPSLRCPDQLHRRIDLFFQDFICLDEQIFHRCQCTYRCTTLLSRAPINVRYACGFARSVAIESAIMLDGGRFATISSASAPISSPRAANSVSHISHIPLIYKIPAFAGMI